MVEVTADLTKATVVGKYNGVIIDAEFADGSVKPIFCSVYGIVQMCVPGVIVYAGSTAGKGRKIPYELEFIEQNNGLIYCRPNRNNDLFEEAFNEGRLPEFAEYSSCRRLDATDHLPHIDFELSSAGGDKCFVFVTNVYHKFGAGAVFPTEVNFFEMEMFEEMQKLCAQGHKTCVFMIMPRTDCQELHFSWKYSPLAAAKIFDAAKNGLNFVGYSCNINKKRVTLSQIIPIVY